MVAIINVVSSQSCPACKACGELLDRIKLEHPDLMVSYHDANDPHVKRFQKLNLNKPISSIKDPAVRQHYEKMGLQHLSGLPTLYITSTRRPNRILDMMVGCINPKSDYNTRKSMTEEINLFVYKAKAYDAVFDSAKGKPRRRSGF